jgi:hypothetical protein
MKQAGNGSLLVLALLAQLPFFCISRGSAAELGLFARTNLVAWCIVPFDAKKRGPEERAQMLKRLGILRLAYDWRAEHVPTFDEEIAAGRRHGIELSAWWFPSALDADAKRILEVLERNKVRTQLWVSGGDPTGTDRVQTEAARIRPIAEAAARIGCSVGLYNHGGWFGEPTNQIAIIRALGMTNVGIVYNFHHGHAHIERFAELFQVMRPHLMAINLNGMIKDGDKHGKKILTIGAGDCELKMLQVIRDSGWHGPMGIIDHRHETDSEETLRENLQGLERLKSLLQER